MEIKIRFNLLAGIAKHAHIIRVKSDIIQVVQITKNRNFSKPGYPGDEEKFNIFIPAFQFGIKISQCFSILIGFFRFVIFDILDNGFIIFIDQNDNPFILF